MRPSRIPAFLTTSVPRLVAMLTLFAAQSLSAAPAITLIATQPTDRSITINARSDTAIELYFQVGVAPGAYTTQTAAVVAEADPYANGFFVSRTVLTNLVANTRYWYRMQYRPAGSAGAFTAGAENTFHTQRSRGSSFAFCIQGDSHPERPRIMFDSALYTQTLAAVAKDLPDFFMMSGDDFSVDTLPAPYTAGAIAGRYTVQLPYLDLVGRTGALFLVAGNHEQAALYNLNLPPNADNDSLVPIWAQNARYRYYPMPAPDDEVTGTFYGGDPKSVPGIGLLRDYYAWEWGDALFVVLDPFWHSPALVDNAMGDEKVTPKTANKWLITHGDEQYRWLKETLEKSTAKWKFVFAHHVLGNGRGGVELARLYEWGGNNADGSPGLAKNRPTWPASIHELMVQNHVTIFFQGHDHVFAHQQIDGMTYQELPSPADPTYTAFNADAYKSGDVLPDSGYVRVTVSATAVKVDYVRQYLPRDETSTARSGTVAFTYTIGAPQSGGAKRRVVAHP